jgi:hypothetical protein
MLFYGKEWSPRDWVFETLLKLRRATRSSALAVA